MARSRHTDDTRPMTGGSYVDQWQTLSLTTREHLSAEPFDPVPADLVAEVAKAGLPFQFDPPGWEGDSGPSRRFLRSDVENWIEWMNHTRLWNLVRVDDPLHRNQDYRIVNDAPTDALNVTVTAAGPLLIDQLPTGRRVVERVPPGASIDFQVVHGWSDQGSGFLVRWRQSPDGPESSQTLLIGDLAVYPRSVRP